MAISAIHYFCREKPNTENGSLKGGLKKAQSIGVTKAISIFADAIIGLAAAVLIGHFLLNPAIAHGASGGVVAGFGIAVAGCSLYAASPVIIPTIKDCIHDLRVKRRYDEIKNQTN